MRTASPFMQKLLGGLLVLTIGALVFGAGAAAAQDWLDPENAVDIVGEAELPEPASLDAPSAVTSGDGVLEVFQTTLSYDGAGPAGYGRSGMHAACRAEDPVAHFCSIQEIETALEGGGLNIVATGQAWIDNVIAGTADSGYNGDVQSVSDWYGGSANGDFPYNCNAWTVSGNANRGMILNSGAISPATEACDDVHPIACCR